MTKPRRLYWIRDSLSNSISAPQSAARSAGSNHRFQFDKRSQLFVGMHNKALSIPVEIDNRLPVTPRRRGIGKTKNAAGYYSALRPSRMSYSSWRANVAPITANLRD
jgi:hypothetical protein